MQRLFTFLSDSAVGYREPGPPALHDLLIGLSAAGLELGPNALPDFLESPPEQLMGNTQVLVCRPLWGGQVSRTFVDALRIPGESFYIATMSAGKGHIASDVRADSTVKVVAASGQNAVDVAEWTIWAAISLRRRLMRAVTNFAVGGVHIDSVNEGTSLRGGTWTLLGAGDTAKEVAVRALGLGLQEIRIWAPRGVAEKHRQLVQELQDAADALIPVTGTRSRVHVTGTLHDALWRASIVSSHVPAEVGEVLDASAFAALRTDCVVINAGRPVGMNVGAAITWVTANPLAGLATDVLGEETERPGAHPKSLGSNGFWFVVCQDHVASLQPSRYLGVESARLGLRSEFGRAPDGWANLVGSPHISGTSADSTQAICSAVTRDLLDELGGSA